MEKSTRLGETPEQMGQQAAPAKEEEQFSTAAVAIVINEHFPNPPGYLQH